MRRIVEVMHLADFVNHFEERIGLQNLLDSAADRDIGNYLLQDSERVFRGNLSSDEIAKVAFFVQPNADLCVKAAEAGFDTFFSHHRWRRRKDGASILGETEEELLSYNAIRVERFLGRMDCIFDLR